VQRNWRKCQLRLSTVCSCCVIGFAWIYLYLKNCAKVRCARQSCRSFGHRLASLFWISFFYFLSPWLIACVDFTVCRCVEHGRFPYEKRDTVTVVRNPHWASDLFAGCDHREQNVNLTATFAGLRTFEVAIGAEIRVISFLTLRQGDGAAALWSYSMIYVQFLLLPIGR
jgi:hypothetical protein